MEKKFHADDNNRVRNNSTIEERRFVFEGSANDETTQYYQTSNSLKFDTLHSDESAIVEEKPPASTSVSTTTLSKKTNSSSKKGKNLDLLHSESDNVNLTIPNNAEVWSLAGMKNVVQTTVAGKQHHDFDETTSGRQSTHSDAKILSDWQGIARMDEIQIAQSKENDELTVTTTESGEVTTTSDKITTTVLPDLDEERHKTTTGYSTIDDKATEIPTTLTTTSEKSAETTTKHSSSFLRSTEGSDEDIITISSALSRTTEIIVMPTTNTRVQTTTKQDVAQTSSILTTAATHSATDDHLSASSEPVFRVTPPYDTTFYTENDRDKYNAANELQITTDSSEITTRKQNVNEENSETSSGSLGVISAVISVVVLLSLIALLYVSMAGQLQYLLPRLLNNSFTFIISTSSSS